MLINLARKFAYLMRENAFFRPIVIDLLLHLAGLLLSFYALVYKPWQATLLGSGELSYQDLGLMALVLVLLFPWGHAIWSKSKLCFNTMLISPSPEEAENFNKQLAAGTEKFLDQINPDHGVTWREVLEREEEAEPLQE